MKTIPSFRKNYFAYLVAISLFLLQVQLGLLNKANNVQNLFADPIRQDRSAVTTADTYTYVNGAVASGTAMTSLHYRSVGVAGEAGMLNNIASLNSENYRLTPGFLAGIVQAPSACSAVPINPNAYSLVYGTVTLNGANAPVGTELRAYNPRGQLVLCMSLDSAGIYALSYLYGEDVATSTTGMRAGEILTWTVNGFTAVASPYLVWANDKDSHQIDLVASSASTATPTPTVTATSTPSATPTATATAINTATSTPTPTATALPAGVVTCNVAISTKFMFAYGSVSINGSLAPAGTQITAYTPRGEIVGCFNVTSPGFYGSMPIYGEDTSVSPTVPGFRDNEPLLFRINGQSTWATLAMTWSDSKEVYQIDLQTIYPQTLNLVPGWQLISLNVNPPQPAIEQVWAGKMDQFCRVTNGVGLWDCRVASQFRTLTEIHHGVAYWIYVTSTLPFTHTIWGLPIANNESIVLNTGWNFAGYLRNQPMLVTTALQGIAGSYRRVFDGTRLYDTNIPSQFNTLTQLEPGHGYLIFATQPANLTYPANSTLLYNKIGEPNNENKHPIAPAICEENALSTRAMFIYGHIGNGLNVASGSRVEAIAPDGSVVGCALFNGKEYGAMVIYGNDVGKASAGYRVGDEIVLRIENQLIKTGLRFTDDFSVHEVNLELSAAQK